MSHCIDKAELCIYNESCNRYCNLTVLYITANNVLLPSAVKREYGTTAGSGADHEMTQPMSQIHTSCRFYYEKRPQWLTGEPKMQFTIHKGVQGTVSHVSAVYD